MNIESRRYRAGDTSPDRPGLVFLRRRPSGKDYWATLEQYEREKRHAREQRREMYHCDPKFREKVLQALIGCSLAAFRVHFESLFTEGMTWEKFMAGEIHIDHKLPFALFDLRDEAQQRAVCYFENLQPLWATENRAKNDLVDGVRARDLRKQNIIPFTAAA